MSEVTFLGRVSPGVTLKLNSAFAWGIRRLALPPPPRFTYLRWTLDLACTTRILYSAIYILPSPGFVFTPSSTHTYLTFKERPTIMIFSFKLRAALLFFALGVSAAPAALSPVHLSKRDVWSPPIITPNNSTVWCIGSEVKVTWYVHPTEVPDANQRRWSGVLFIPQP